MITNQDRSKWIGASDTSTVMGNWETKSFIDWWLVKLGLFKNSHKSWAMDCGNLLERPIIRKIEKIENRRIKLGKRPRYKPFLRLRCNYDGLTNKELIEIKTSEKGFKSVPKNYWQQCQVLMWSTRKKRTALYLYKMEYDDYLNPYFPNIDESRIIRFEIEYDQAFIKEYKKRLKYLAWCLKKKKIPNAQEFESEYKNEIES